MSDNIFDLPFEERVIEKIPALQYAKESKEVFKELMSAYSSSHYRKKVTDEEADIAPCENCKGCGSFEFAGKKIDCHMDREGGSCFQTAFDHENFYGEVVESIMFGEKSDYFRLLESEIDQPTLTNQ